jgi:hypothetical protein
MAASDFWGKDKLFCQREIARNEMAAAGLEPTGFGTAGRGSGQFVVWPWGAWRAGSARLVQFSTM